MVNSIMDKEELLKHLSEYLKTSPQAEAELIKSGQHNRTLSEYRHDTFSTGFWKELDGLKLFFHLGETNEKNVAA